MKNGGAIMKKSLLVFFLAPLIGGFFRSSVVADDTLVKFKGGIGVIPVSSTAGTQNDNGTFPDVNRNVVRGVNPPGQIWVIDELDAKVKTNGDIKVKGKGLLLGGGNNIGTTNNQSVRARLFCGAAVNESDLVALEPNGDFTIDDILTPVSPTVAPVPPNPCTTPVLLIISSGGSWFAAGIPDLK
jgi:hypothetical protein